MSKLGVVGACVALFIFLIMGLSSCSTVDSGEIGLYKRFGEISNETAGPGLHFVNPFTTSIETMNVQSQRWNGQTPIYTSDLQTADVQFTVIYSLQPTAAARMRQTVGHEWAARLIPPVVESMVKTTFGKISANEAIASRSQLQSDIQANIRKRLAERGINLESFELKNIDYSDAFEKAVENAQVATQTAIAAKNATVTIEEQAKQRIITAESEAKSIQVQAQAITTNPAIVQMKAVQKWDGRLPQNMYGSNAVPFIQTK